MGRDKKEEFLIFGFLRKILNKEEEEVFKSKMKDEEFQAKVSNETINQAGRIKLKSKLDDLHTSVINEQKRRRTFLRILGLSVAVLITYILWQFVIHAPNSDAQKPDQIFAQYFEPYANIFDQKGKSDTSNKDIDSAMDAYSNHQYSESIRLFEKYFKENSAKTSLSSFYYGIALLANGEHKKSLTILQELNQNKSAQTIISQTPLHWYLALAYLKSNNISEAKPLLEAVAKQNVNSFKQKEANEILKSLNFGD